LDKEKNISTVKPSATRDRVSNKPHPKFFEFNRAITIAIALLAFLSSAVFLVSCGKIPLKQETFDPEASGLLRMEASAASYPDADIVYLLNEVVNEVSESGESLETVHTVIKILTEAGRSYANCEIGYNSRTESLSLHYARTIQADGSVIPLKKDAIKVESPNLGEGKYSDYKEMSFSMPGIGIDSIIDYKYVKKSTPDINGEFNCHFFFQDDNPVLLSRYMIIAPETVRIKFHLKNPLDGLSGDPVISHTEGKKTYMWEYKNIPQIPDEERRPPLGDIAFQLFGTTMPSWDEFCTWWWTQARDKADANHAIEKKVQELTGDLKGSDEKIAVLFNYVKKDIRYITISLGKSGMVPKTASEVYENKYGDCKDKSTLLIAMLRVVGVASHYALIPTRSRGDLVKEFPYPFQFNHCIVAIEREGTVQFLDPTSKTNRFDYLPAGDQGRGVIVIKDGKPDFRRTPLGGAYANGIISQKNI